MIPVDGVFSDSSELMTGLPHDARASFVWREQVCLAAVKKMCYVHLGDLSISGASMAMSFILWEGCFFGGAPQFCFLIYNPCNIL